MATLAAAVAPLFRAGPEEGPGLSSRPMDRVAGAMAVAPAEPLAAAVAASQAEAEDTRVAEEECPRVGESPQVVPPAAAVAAGTTDPFSHWAC